MEEQESMTCYILVWIHHREKVLWYFVLAVTKDFF